MATKTPLLNPMPMKNGKFHIVLLAGGPRDIAREIRDKLAAKRDVFIKYHYEYDKEQQWNKPIPKDVDFVIVLKDMISHSLFYKIKESCKQAGLRWIVTQRKLSIMTAALANYGIRRSDGIPVNVQSVAYFDNSEPEIAPVITHPAVRKAKEKNVEPAKKVVVQKEEPAKEVNIFVSPAPVPEGTPLTPRQGVPRPETMVLIAALQQMVQDDKVSIMITPTQIAIEPAE